MTGVLDPPAKGRTDLVSEVAIVRDRPRQDDGPPGAPRRADGQVGCFFGGDTAEPHQVLPTGSQRPFSDVDSVVYHRKW